MEKKSPSRQPVGKERILQIAERLFLARGYRAVSIRDIAQACQVTNAALYYYFPSKEALFREMLLAHVARLTQALEKAQQAAASNPRAQLTAMLTVYARWALEHRASFFAVRRDALALSTEPTHPDSPFRKVASQVLHPFDQVLQQAIGDGLLPAPPYATSLGSMLLGMLHGLLFGLGKAEPPDEMLEEIARWTVRVFWQGLEARRPEATP